MTAQILLGANQATKFPQAVKDVSGELFQVNQARLMKSKITGKYIYLGAVTHQYPLKQTILNLLKREISSITNKKSTSKKDLLTKTNKDGLYPM